MKVGIDIGGTFTDLVAAGDDGLRVVKVPSTPDDPARAFLDALDRIGGPPDEIRHGTTVATNAVLTRTGAKVGFVGTEGFRHLLQLARQDRPSLYDLRVRRPDPLVDAALCVGAPERIGPDGSVLRALDRDAVAARLAELDVDGIAVCLLHAYANPDHERGVREVAVELLGPDLGVSLSSDVLPEFREYERASTTVLNAYVQPLMTRYLSRIDAVTAEARVGVMWSGGGVRSISRTSDRPVHTLLSGPAAGVLAATWVARRMEITDVVTLDMGGTSADVSIVSGGEPLYAEESSLDGLPFSTPCIDVVSVGAGGGSVGWVDEGGAMRVGPRSAGAEPGPAAYGRGGEEPTVTDAHILLGHLGGRGLAGGELRLDAGAAADAMSRLANRTGLEPRETAQGILRVVEATMARAIRSVTIERGHDVRRYALVAFGGAGGLHAVALARELGIETVIVPPAAGALAALGLLVAARRAESSVSRPMRAAPQADAELRDVLDGLAQQAFDELAEEGIGREEATLAHDVDCRYEGQSHELRIPVPGEPSYAGIVRAFGEAHRQRYGFSREGVPIEAVTFRAVAAGPLGEVALQPPSGGRDAAPLAERSAAGGSGVPVFDRGDLGAGWQAEGPAIIVELDSTTLVPAGASARVDASGSLVIRP